MYYIQTARVPQIRRQRLTYAEVAVRHGRLRVFEDRSLALSPIVALAGVGWYDGVFHTIIARGALRARNVMISKGWCAPAVFSIPITRSSLQNRATFLEPRLGFATTLLLASGLARSHGRLHGS